MPDSDHDIYSSGDLPDQELSRAEEHNPCQIKVIKMFLQYKTGLKPNSISLAPLFIDHLQMVFFLRLAHPAQMT